MTPCKKKFRTVHAESSHCALAVNTLNNGKQAASTFELRSLVQQHLHHVMMTTRLCRLQRSSVHTPPHGLDGGDLGSGSG
jgi:hypothetical protein